MLSVSPIGLQKKKAISNVDLNALDKKKAISFSGSEMMALPKKKAIGHDVFELQKKK